MDKKYFFLRNPKVKNTNEIENFTGFKVGEKFGTVIRNIRKKSASVFQQG